MGIIKQELKQGGTKGMLQMDLYAIFTRRVPDVPIEKMRSLVPEHLKFQVELERKGIMFGAGPLFPPNSEVWEGEGMVIIRAASLEQAREVAEQDPMHIAKLREFVIRPWMMNEGSLNLRVTYSNGKVEIS
jgi:uncharacterized protein